MNGSTTRRACMAGARMLVVGALVGACGSAAEVPGAGRSSAPSSAETAQPVQTGRLQRWPEATEHLTIDFQSEPARATLGDPRPTGLDAFWSVASTSGAGSAFFYADSFRVASETRVAYVKSTAHVRDIHDASSFDYSHPSVGPVSPGEIVLVHHLPSGRYLAIVIEAIQPADASTAGAGPYAYADVTWYLTAAASADFSNAP